MSSRFGRNKRRKAREALAQMHQRLVDQIEVSRKLSIDLSNKKIESEKLRKVLVAGTGWPARAIGLSGPFRDNISLITLAQEAKS